MAPRLSRLLILSSLVALSACTPKPPPQALEIPEILAEIDLTGWAFYDRPGDNPENPHGFVEPMFEPIEPGRIRAAKQPHGGTELVYVTGARSMLPAIRIFGMPPPAKSATAPPTLDECSKPELEMPHDAVSWKVSPPETISSHGIEMRVFVIDWEEISGLDVTTEVAVIARNGFCYTLAGSTLHSQWKSQRPIVEKVITSIRPH